MEDRLSQFQNAASPILVSPPPNEIFVIRVQNKNALFPTLATFSVKSTLVRLEQ